VTSAIVAGEKEEVGRRNITLHFETYERLDKYLFELAQRKRVLKVSRNDAIETLLDEHYQKREKE
jgi:hypothetical protein